MKKIVLSVVAVVFLLAGAAFIFLFGSFTVSPEKAISFPLEQSSHNFLQMDAELNGQPAKLMLDTGATMNVITLDFARELGINLSFLPSLAGTDHLGQPMSVKLLPTLDMSMNGNDLTLYKVAIVDNTDMGGAGVHGVFNPLATFSGPIEMDLKNNTLTAFPETKVFDELNTEANWDGNVLFLASSLTEGSEVLGLVDTGSYITKYEKPYIESVMLGVDVSNMDPADFSQTLPLTQAVYIAGVELDLEAVGLLNKANHSQNINAVKGYIGYDFLKDTLIRINKVGDPRIYLDYQG
ncbi:retropepsin-like aspartic protease [Agaribacterium sp. ZY112]|uniref:retropepsin-like aspartic protease n=1 Tax=Agaribacterium sp. ZY112 TaxID=3233574 RepID=UPI0035246702